MRVQVGTKWNRLAVQSQVERTICAARLMSDMGDTFYRDDAEREILYRAAASRLIFTHSANESRRARSFVKLRVFAPAMRRDACGALRL